jgi:hypothetical protein
MSVYLDRFLNVPPAAAPPGEAGEPEALLEALLGACDRRSSVDETAAIARGFIDGGGDPRRLLATLGRAVTREDSGFHEQQQLDIAATRLRRRGPSEAASRSLVACARWLAAQYPTRRAREQTFSIARRLHRGESLHEG